MPIRLTLTLLLALGVGFAVQAAPRDQVPPIADSPWPGTIQLEVDASNIGQRIFSVHETIPVTPGPLTLLYPEWIPGHHSPTGPIDKFAGLVIHGGGQRLPWVRDKYNVYAFHVDVPAGVRELELDFKYLSPQSPSQGRIVMTPVMMNVQWDAMSLYPAGHNIRKITFKPSITLPSGWHWAAALEQTAVDGNSVHFKPVSYNVLVDSPMFAGKYFKRVDLDPGGEVPVYLDVFADDPSELEMSDHQIELHRNLVDQLYALYGAQHYDHYDLMLAISDQLGGIGLEHHRSSENGVGLGYFSEWDSHWARRTLLPHEFNHSWNGKYRRPADLTTANFNVPMGDSLLWVYEGQDTFYGNVLAVRSGLLSKQQGFAKLAGVAARYDRGRPGMAWRNIQDTTNDPTIAERAPLPWRSYQMSEDYYAGGQLIWLAVDAKLRQLSDNRHSLDDFARAFFGRHDGDWTVNTYTFDDVVATLDGIEPFQWKTFLRHRLDGHVNLSQALPAQGWKLVYTDQPSVAVSAYQKRRDVAALTYSLGLTVNKDGGIRSVLWGSPAFDAGLSSGMSLVAVDGRAYSNEGLTTAVREAAKAGHDQPIKLLVKNFDRYRTVNIDYHEGLQYPHLERIEGQPDYLSDVYTPL